MKPVRLADLRVRPLDAATRIAARAVIEAAAAGDAYASSSHWWIDAAVSGPADEARGLVVEHDGSIAGVAVFGFFAGTTGAGRLHVVVVAPPHRRLGAGAALLSAAVTTLRGLGARFVLAEVPDDPPALGGYRRFLEANGFREESRVEGLVRDGVALAFLRRDLA